MSDRFVTRKETQERRKSMNCKVYSCKIDKSHLNKTTKEHLTTLFKEAKWFYNYCISHIDDVDTKIREVSVKVKDQYETRTLTVLSAQMKQAIKERIVWSMSSLHALERKGRKVGKLKFKSIVNSIPLRQYQGTYDLDLYHNRVRIQRLWLRVRGLKQIPQDAEIANAVLIRKNGDYYINVTTFSQKEEKDVQQRNQGQVRSANIQTFTQP